MITRHQGHKRLHGLSASLIRRKIQRCQRRLGNGHDVELHMTVADLYKHLGEDALALESYCSAVESLLKNGTPLETHDSDQLITIYKGILALSPNNDKIAQKLGQEYVRRGLYYRAVELHSSLAERYVKEGDSRKAAKQYQQVCAVEPGSITARIRCANLYCELGENEYAVREYSHIGDIYFEHQQFDGALEYYQQALTQAPDNEAVKQKIEITQQILDGTLIPQAQASLQKFTLIHQDNTDLKRSLVEKEHIEQELRENIQALKQRYQQSVTLKNKQLRSTRKRLEELSTYVAVFKDNLEQIALEKQKLQEQLDHELSHKSDLEQKLARLSTLDIRQQPKPSGDDSSVSSDDGQPQQTIRLESAVNKLQQERSRLEKQLQHKLEQTSQRERQLREHLKEQISQGTTLEHQLEKFSLERDQVEQQLQRQLDDSLHREDLLKEQIKQLIGQHEHALQQVEHEKQMFEKKYRTTQARINLVETDTMTTLEQLHGELSRQCEVESSLSEKFHESLQEISMLLHNQEREIQELEQL